MFYILPPFLRLFRNDTLLFAGAQKLSVLQMLAALKKKTASKQKHICDVCKNSIHLF